MKSISHKVFIFLFIPIFLVSLCLMAKGWNGSLIDYFGFRQTQTAISSFYMLKGGDLIRYQTPVLGPPWLIPMEFPFYQMVVAALVKLTGYGLDQSGRLISVLFFVSVLYPFYMLARPYFADKSRAFIPLIILCLSPQYIFWSRTFMIESTALSLSIWYLFFIRKYLDGDKSSRYRSLALIFILAFGVLAGLTKVTTFFIYFFIGALFMVQTLLPEREGKGLLREIKQYIPFMVVALVIPITAIVAWTHYSDHIKALNVSTQWLTSASLAKWNFGTLAQKMTLNTWSTILNRSSLDLLGNQLIVLPIIALLPFCSRKTIMNTLIILLLYIIPFAVFTNLFFVHSYYVYANGILLILAISIVLGDLSEMRLVFITSDLKEKSVQGRVLCLLMILIISFLCYQRYMKYYYKAQGATFKFEKRKADVDKYTSVNDVLVIYGADWSSEMPYYLQRKALMLGTIQLNDPKYQIQKSSLSANKIGTVAVCGDSRDSVDLTQHILDDFFGRERLIKTSYDTLNKCDFYFREVPLKP